MRLDRRITRIKFLILIVFVTLNSSEKLNSSSQFKCTNICQKCDVNSIECTDLNLSNFDLIKNPFENVSSIVFTGNRIKQLSSPIFQSESFVKQLDLSNNKISFINNSDVFNNLPALKKLIVNDNEINLIDVGYGFLKPISRNLKSLSLANAFNKTVGSYLIFEQIYYMVRVGGVKYLESLNLDSNLLTKLTRRYDDEYDEESANYKFDLICYFPDLKELSLANNLLNTLNLNSNCVRRTNLKQLNLASNSFTRIDQVLINKFERIKKIQPDFRVFLANNPFVCDCNLYNFYNWIKSNSTIVIDKYELFCSDLNSLNGTRSKRILESNLEDYCFDSNEQNNSDDPTSKNQANKIYILPGRNRTTKNTTTIDRPNYLYKANSRLVVSLISIFVILVILYLVFKLHLKKGSSKYRHINRPVRHNPDGSIQIEPIYQDTSSELNDDNLFRDRTSSRAAVVSFFNRIFKINKLKSRFSNIRRSIRKTNRSNLYNRFDTNEANQSNLSINSNSEHILNAKTVELKLKKNYMNLNEIENYEEEEDILVDPTFMNIEKKSKINEFRKKLRNNLDKYTNSNDIIITRIP